MTRCVPMFSDARRTRGGVRAALIGAIAAAGAGCGPTSFVITAVPAAPQLVEHEVLRESLWARLKIAIVDVDGPLRNRRESTLLGVERDNPVVVFQEKLDKAAADRDVRAVVVRINSPGGGVTASDLMYGELRRFRERSGKPVIAYLLDVAASGGYYLACGADAIFAHPTSVTGSIGVILIAPDVSRTLDKIGVQTNVFKSGELKDAGSPLRMMTDRDREVFEGMIERMYARFLDVVCASRTKLSREQVRALADGRVLTAEEAHERGLVDRVGSIHDAIAAARDAGGIGRRPMVVVEYARGMAHRPNVYAQADGASVEGRISLIHVELPDWLRDGAPQLLYLWAPGL